MAVVLRPLAATGRSYPVPAYRGAVLRKYSVLSKGAVPRWQYAGVVFIGNGRGSGLSSVSGAP